MKPSYLEQLADVVDPDKLWRLPVLESLNLPPEQRQRLDAGVALRRYASHMRELQHASTYGTSILITPLSDSANSIAVMNVRTPRKHARLRRRLDGTRPSLWERFLRWCKRPRVYVSHNP